MQDGLTDNKASVPRWARWLIVKIWGQEVMDELDRIGSKHDRRLTHGVLRWVANRMMIADMVRSHIMPALLTLILWSLLQLYAAIPPRLRAVYWRLV